MNSILKCTLLTVLALLFLPAAVLLMAFTAPLLAAELIWGAMQNLPKTQRDTRRQPEMGDYYRQQRIILDGRMAGR